MKSKLIKSDIIDRIRIAFKKGGLTAYMAGSGTTLTDEGIIKILDGRIKNPRWATIDILVDWLFKEHRYSKKWLEEGIGEMLLKEDEQFSVFDHKIELFNRFGKEITDDEFAAYFEQNKSRLLNNVIMKMIVGEEVKNGIIDYYRKDRDND